MYNIRCNVSTKNLKLSITIFIFLLDIISKKQDLNILKVYQTRTEYIELNIVFLYYNAVIQSISYSKVKYLMSLTYFSSLCCILHE